MHIKKNLKEVVRCWGVFIVWVLFIRDKFRGNPILDLSYLTAFCFTAMHTIQKRQASKTSSKGQGQFCHCLHLLGSMVLSPI